MFKDIIYKLFKTSKHTESTTNLSSSVVVFSDEDKIEIQKIISESSLDFFYINNYGQNIIKNTTLIFDDDLINGQSTLMDEANLKISEILSILTSMNETNFNLMKVKEMNLLAHYYKDNIETHLMGLHEKQKNGQSIFKKYDIYIEAAKSYILEQKSGIFDSTDPFEQSKNQENRKNLDRFDEKVVKLYNNKLYHLQAITQMNIIISIIEKIYEQINEIIFIVIPILKNKVSITNSLENMNKIKENLKDIKKNQQKNFKILNKEKS